MIPREMYMSRIRPFIGSELIKVMTGIRRCGKSVMLELIKQELTSSGICPSQFISINFENMGYAHLQTAKALHDEILKRAAEIGGKVYLFFDEIQEVKDWEKCVNSLRVALDCDIYITGSNAKLLSGELATYLGGRYEFVIYPFSFAEFMELYRSILPDEPVQKCFQKYLLSGGMPYLANIRYAEEPSRQYLHDLFRSIQLKDIVQRNKIRDVDLLERIIAYVMAHVGTTFSATSVAKYWKSEQRAVAPETILNYLKYCCDAYLLYQVKREDLQGKQILASNEKYYLADHGIREAATQGTSTSFLRTSSIWSCCAEATTSRLAEPETRRSTSYATGGVKSCMSRLPICWHRRKPSPANSACMMPSGITFPSMWSHWTNST